MSLRRALFLSAALLAVLALSVSLWAAPPSSALNGAWHFVCDTEGGQREFDASFSVAGEQVTGKWAEFDVKGTCTEGAFELAFPFSAPDAGSGTLNVKGTIGDSALSGTWEFSGYTGTFKAARPSNARP